PTRFFRFGDWQLRKLEEYLLEVPDDLQDSPEWPLWEAYVRWSVKRWHEGHPDDPRKVRRLVFLRRRIYFPPPDADPTDFAPPPTHIPPPDRECRARLPPRREAVAMSHNPPPRSFFGELYDFWCKPVRAEPVALFRILLGLTILGSLLTGVGARLVTYCGPAGLRPAQTGDEWLRRTGRVCLLP